MEREMEDRDKRRRIGLGNLVRGGTQRPGELWYRSGTIGYPYFYFPPGTPSSYISLAIIIHMNCLLLYTKKLIILFPKPVQSSFETPSLSHSLLYKPPLSGTGSSYL